MDIYYTNKFKREYKKICKEIKIKAESQEFIFRKNPFDKRLKTHKLNGELEGLFSFSVDFKNRIVFEFINNDNVCFYSIGGHDIYR
jgi:mRNA-degrading endonuclease YafQ of YafQ-DinJ toxin-antitoxin module